VLRSCIPDIVVAQIQLSERGVGLQGCGQELGPLGGRRPRKPSLTRYPLVDAPGKVYVPGSDVTGAEKESVAEVIVLNVKDLLFARTAFPFIIDNTRRSFESS
jgi:hypothetical protein